MDLVCLAPGSQCCT